MTILDFGTYRFYLHILNCKLNTLSLNNNIRTSTLYEACKVNCEVAYIKNINGLHSLLVDSCKAYGAKSVLSVLEDLQRVFSAAADLGLEAVIFKFCNKNKVPRINTQNVMSLDSLGSTLFYLQEVSENLNFTDTLKRHYNGLTDIYISYQEAIVKSDNVIDAISEVNKYIDNTSMLYNYLLFVSVCSNIDLVDKAKDTINVTQYLVLFRKAILQKLCDSISVSKFITNQIQNMQGIRIEHIIVKEDPDHISITQKQLNNAFNKALKLIPSTSQYSIIENLDTRGQFLQAVFNYLKEDE